MPGKNVIVHTVMGSALDIEIPMNITANELIQSLHAALKLPGEVPGYIRSENPIAMICGDVPIEAFGIRDGSRLYFGGTV